MSSFAFMKVLESSPNRYDRGIKILSRGRITEVYLKIAEMVAAPGKRILDIGCGTGNVSLACAARGATVIGVDSNAEMLEITKSKAKKAGLEDKVELIELGVAEIAGEINERPLDAVVSCLAFSELTPDEQTYTLSIAYSLLKPGGVIVIADEVVPKDAFRRFRHRLVSLPLVLVTYILTQTTTRPLNNPSPLLNKAGFANIETTSMWSSFMIIRAFREVEL
jgi:cyclopropane fatty-acyl-phospholipid synthase-like methyltransferase